MTSPLLKSVPEAAPAQLPPDLPLSTVSEIASWLVGHTIDAVESELIRHTLESCGGDRTLAASVLGISVPNLNRKLRGFAVRGVVAPEAAECANENSVAAAPALPAEEPAPATVPDPVPPAQPRERFSATDLSWPPPAVRREPDASRNAPHGGKFRGYG